MKRNRLRNIRHKAASAALAVIAASGIAARAEVPPCGGCSFCLSPAAPQTLPATPDVRGRLDAARRSFHFRLAETPVMLREFLADFPSSTYAAEARLMLADWHFFNHEYAMALADYSEIADGAFSGDTRRGMLYRKAFSMVKCGYYDEAAAAFAELAGSSDFGYDSRFYLAYIDYVKGRYDDAYRTFRTIKESEPRGAEAEYYLNQMDYRNGDYRKVANTSERLLSGEQIPDELRAETMRVGGLAFFKLGDKTSAKNILGRYADLAGDGAEISALYSLASIYYDEGNYDKALPLFSIVTEYPGDLAQSAWLYIGQIYMQRGDGAAAALAFDKAAKESWNPDVAETAAYNLAVTSTEGSALPFSNAASAMEAFIDTYPASPYSQSLSSYLANAYYGHHDYANALRQVEKITPADERTRLMRQKILYQLGVAQLRQKETAQAIRSLSEASSPSAPDKEVAAQASLWLGDAYYAQGNYREARKAYEKAADSKLLGDNLALADYNLGYACLKLRDYRKAEAAFRDASTLPGLDGPLRSDARMRYADCLYYNGKYSQASALFRDIKLGGGSDAVYAGIREADILGKDGKVSEKIALLESLVDSPDAGVWRTVALSRLADSYSERGDDRKAAELYARMLDSAGKGTDNSQTYYSLATNAENLYNAGDIAAAYNAYKRLENSGIAALYPPAVTGVMRTSADNAEIAEYAAKVAALPGQDAEDINEALFMGAEAGIRLGGQQRRDALQQLDRLAHSSDRLWGARAAVTLGQQLLDNGDTAGAEEVLLHLVDNGSDDSYWLARGYIALADVYAALGKDYLARLYLENLRSNYPGSEKDIRDMISSRLKSLDK